MFRMEQIISGMKDGKDFVTGCYQNITKEVIATEKVFALLHFLNNELQRDFPLLATTRTISPSETVSDQARDPLAEPC